MMEDDDYNDVNKELTEGIQPNTIMLENDIKENVFNWLPIKTTFQWKDDYYIKKNNI